MSEKKRISVNEAKVPARAYAQNKPKYKGAHNLQILLLTRINESQTKICAQNHTLNLLCDMLYTKLDWLQTNNTRILLVYNIASNLDIASNCLEMNP